MDTLTFANLERSECSSPSPERNDLLEVPLGLWPACTLGTSEDKPIAVVKCQVSAGQGYGAQLFGSNWSRYCCEGIIDI